MSLKLNVVVCSTRPGRVGPSIGQWFEGFARAHGGFEVELADLAQFALPVFDEPHHPRLRKYEHAHTKAWSASVDSADAFVFVTPEYNHGVPGAFKNAVDSLGEEFVGKAVSLVGYGSVGGVRAIENWRTVLANFSMKVTRYELNLSTFLDWSEGLFEPLERRTEELAELFEALEQAAS